MVKMSLAAAITSSRLTQGTRLLHVKLHSRKIYTVLPVDLSRLLVHFTPHEKCSLYNTKDGLKLGTWDEECRERLRTEHSRIPFVTLHVYQSVSFSSHLPRVWTIEANFPKFPDDYIYCRKRGDCDLKGPRTSREIDVGILVITLFIVHI